MRSRVLARQAGSPRPAPSSGPPVGQVTALRPQRAVVRRDAGNWALQGALDRRGLGPVAGVDEAGRGACAGPLVVASCVLRPNDARHLDRLTDSKLLTEKARERMYDLVLARALDYAIMIIPPAEVDQFGVHAANIEGMRRAIATWTPIRVTSSPTASASRASPRPTSRW